jgi:hypothetical protein
MSNEEELTMTEPQASESARPWQRRPGCILSIAAVIALLVGGVWIYFNLYQGRDISRITGRPVQITLPECVTSADQVVSVSFHTEASGETIKDVTYVCDGHVYSHEYNDFGILQGSVEWTFRQR